MLKVIREEALTLNSLRNKLCQDLKIDFPMIQAGMVWVSGGKLAAAAANAGILGTIGAGSMHPDLLKAHITKARSLTNRSIAVNVPLLYKEAEKQLHTALDAGIRIFITSAGSPKKWTPLLKKYNSYIIHVVSSPTLAKKCEDAGCDAVIAEGFEAGGHNGRDELTTMVLVPLVKKSISLPVIAAGGIAAGQQIAAAFNLGATAVQLGTKFVATKESSAHKDFKTKIIESQHDATKLCMKTLVPVRLLKNKFYNEVSAAENEGAAPDELRKILGKGRAKAGMLQGNLEEGELEIGQACALIEKIPNVSEVVESLYGEYKEALKQNLLFKKRT